MHLLICYMGTKGIQYSEEPFMIYFDGSFQQQDSAAGVGVVVLQRGEKVSSVAKGMPGRNSYLAEINALLTALEEAMKIKTAYPSATIELFGDNKGVIDMFRRRKMLRVKTAGKSLRGLVGETIHLYEHAVDMFTSLGSAARLDWIPRDLNQAHSYSKAGRKEQSRDSLPVAA